MVKLAKGLRIGALAAGIAIVVLAAYLTVVAERREAIGILKISIEDTNLGGLPFGLRALLMMVPALTFAYSMWQLARLLKLAADGEVFSAPAAHYLRSFGVWLLITTLLHVFLGFVIKGLYLWLSAAEHGQLDLSLNSRNVWNIFISALFMLVARVLADAYAIAEENKQII